MLDQIAIVVTGVIAIWLANDTREEWRRYACLFGLAGQPFWFYSAFDSGQYGILILTLFYTLSWIRGFMSHWVRQAVEKAELAWCNEICNVTKVTYNQLIVKKNNLFVTRCNRIKVTSA